MHINKILNIVYRSKICSHHVSSRLALFRYQVFNKKANTGSSNGKASTTQRKIKLFKLGIPFKLLPFENLDIAIL